MVRDGLPGDAAHSPIASFGLRSKTPEAGGWPSHSAEIARNRNTRFARLGSAATGSDSASPAASVLAAAKALDFARVQIIGDISQSSVSVGQTPDTHTLSTPEHKSPSCRMGFGGTRRSRPVDDMRAEPFVIGIGYDLGWFGQQAADSFHTSAGCGQLSSPRCSAWLTNPTPSSRGGFRKRRGSL